MVGSATRVTALGRVVGRSWSTGLGVAVLAFLAIAVVYPIVAMLRRFGSDTISVTGPAIVKLVGFTVGQAALSTVLTLLVGLPLSHVLATYRLRWRSLILAAVLIPFVLPTVVVAVSVRSLLQRFGLAADGIDGSLVAILLAHVVFNVSVVVRLVSGYWSQLDPRVAEAASALGASPSRRFRRITLPLLRPAILASAAIVFLFTFTSFGVIIILGGLGRATVETEIYRFAITRNDFGSAAALAVVQAVAVAGMAVANQRLQHRLLPSNSGSQRPRVHPVGRQWIYANVVIASTLAFLLAPLVELLVRSLTVDGSFGFDHFTALTERPNVLPVSPARSLANSIGFAALAALLAGSIGTAAALVAASGSRLAQLVETAVLIPLGISAVTLGFGYLVGFTFFELRRSPILVIVAHAIIGIPFVVGAVLPALRAIDGNLLDAGSSLGASPSRVIQRVLSPLVRPAIASGAGFAAAVSMGEFGASGFLARGRSSYTAPQAIFGLIGQPGSSLQGQASALCVLLGCVIVALVVAIDRARGTSTGGWL